MRKSLMDEPIDIEDFKDYKAVIDNLCRCRDLMLQITWEIDGGFNFQVTANNSGENKECFVFSNLSSAVECFNKLLTRNK